ncbi:haloacid dehalogenase-like hydrolase [Psychroflexus torquis ATCC 700755]|uniref:Haloacid dehalogenase-like hydrolase n=1 Tax=Psychroflexus torquis (strain ATCC 700755 / CIP 106069 / ACAM 623) TaxID=313595 RepID=K4IB65_PSYTT|nr:Cof-type HAD-IIB family hydrolase [Psychroflexus torquis]AFU67669.1 haloacid dehalogenase-like hydrolase [Psychroflexus torquis ATCC 700755]
MIKLICSDIDGTLLNTEREISRKTKIEFHKLKHKLPIILISSRMPSAMKHLQRELGIEKLPLVAYNGGLILVDNEVKQSTTLSFELVKEIIGLNKDSLHLSLFQKDKWYAPEQDQWTQREINNTKVNPEIKNNTEVLDLWEPLQTGAHKIMCMGDPSLINDFYTVLSNKFPNDLHLYRSKDTYIEIAPKQISKRSAIEFLISSEYKFEFSQVMSFGDNYNDIEMLQASGLGLAVGNAKEEVKAIADKIIGNAKKNGVAEFLSHYFKTQ